MKKNVLGKGLNSLIPNYENKNSDPNNYTLLNIELLYANVNQPRKHFNDSSLHDLSKSIEIHGIIQPLIVSESNGKYLIVAGERRYRAAKIIKIPCIIIEKSTDEILELSLIENIQRDDLNPIEEARAFKNLIDNFNITHECLSEKLSISRTSITNKLRLLKLSSIVQDYILNEDITEGHGKILAGVKDEHLQIEISNKIIDEDLNVRQTEKLIQSIFSKPKEKINCKNDVYINDLKLNLENYFGTKVSIHNKKNKGNIQIEYYSVEDLNRILDLIYSKDV